MKNNTKQLFYIFIFIHFVNINSFAKNEFYIEPIKANYNGIIGNEKKIIAFGSQGSLNISYRPKVDLLFYNILLQDGTAKFRAWYMYQAVKNFGEKYALPTTEKDENEKIFRV